MKISAPVVLAAAYAVSIGSAYAMLLNEPNCKPNDCTITVSVGGNSCGGGISVSPDPVTVKASGNAVTMQWKIVTPGWVFDTNGIYLNMPGGDFGKGAGEGKDMYTIDNLAKAARTVKYDVNLRKAEKAGDKCKVDPTIMNY